MQLNQSEENPNSICNIVLTVCATFMIGLLITNGPPSTVTAPATETNRIEYIPMGIAHPDQIIWYELRDNVMGLSVMLERDDENSWQSHGQSTGIADVQVAEVGAQLISSFTLRKLIQFGPNDSLGQYGLTTNPHFVVSFTTNAYNKHEETFTLYVGSLTPDRQEYYAVFVDETFPGDIYRQGTWVYLIRIEYVDTLMDTMFNSLSDGASQRNTEVPTP